jgi:homoserine dehydrogenase
VRVKSAEIGAPAGRRRRSELRVALLGFGHVGRAFAKGLLGPYRKALAGRRLQLRVVGVATRAHGAAVNARGLDLRRCLARAEAGGSLASLHRGAPLPSSLAFVTSAPADVLVELTPLDPLRGEPATTHVRAALRRGLHVVTANKGPVAFAWSELKRLARRHRCQLLHEGAVMDGTPVFNLVSRCLPGCRILGFRGTLNSTSSHVLTRMEEGASLEAAVREAQAAGITEADPRADLSGWDSAVKGCALANALMGASVRPGDVKRRGILRVTPERARQALGRDRRIRLVVRGFRDGPRVRVRVAPEELPLGDPLSAPGPDAVLILETDLMGEVGVHERGGTVEQAAYAVLSDLLTLHGPRTASLRVRERVRERA